MPVVSYDNGRLRNVREIHFYDTVREAGVSVIIRIVKSTSIYNNCFLSPIIADCLDWNRLSVCNHCVLCGDADCLCHKEKCPEGIRSLPRDGIGWQPQSSLVIAAHALFT